MSDSDELERRYRRLLALYPAHVRRDREQEMLTMLMDGAEPGQRWPRLRDAADVSGHAVAQRFSQPPALPRRYPVPILVIRVLLAVWLVILCVILTRHSTWGLAVIAPWFLNLFLILRLVAWVRAGRPDGGDLAPRV